MKIGIAIFAGLLMLFGLACYAQAKDASAIEALEAEISLLKSQMKELNETNRLQAEQLSKALSETNAQVTNIKLKDEADVHQVKTDLIVGATRNHWASILLMIGLFMEIIGATLLAGNSLMGGVKDIYRPQSRQTSRICKSSL